MAGRTRMGAGEESKTSLPLTQEQQDWVDALLAGKPNFLSARAGTGKTSTILAGLEALDRSPGKWSPSMFTLVAFNKENQLDLQAKAAGTGAQIATLHSLGFAALRRYNRSLELDSKKIFQLMVEAGFKGKNRRARFSETMRLVSVAKNWGLGAGLLEDKPDEWIDLADMYCLHQADLEIAREALGRSNKLAREQGLVDFDDMVYLPLVWKLGLETRAGVIVDEAQDLSPLNLALLKKTPGKKWYVGDPFQCIYQFRGARNGGGLGVGLPELPLTTCWRCDREIIQEARKWVGDIQARPGARSGEVLHECRHVDWTKEQPGALLARNNEDLVDVALALWNAGRPVYILGRDFGRALLDALEEIHGDGAGLRDGIKDWAEHKADRYPNQAGHYLALGKVLLAFWYAFKGRKRMEMNIGTFFSDQPRPGAWVLSTIHRAKGKEWDEVWLLDWERAGSEPWSLEAERNLHYVAITRARHRLHIVPEPWWQEARKEELEL